VRTWASKLNLAPSSVGGIFDPAGFSKGDMASLKLKEIKNARLAMLVRSGE
jgi:Chlorophyll A-B binding protein